MYLNKLKTHCNFLIFLSVIFFHQTLIAEEQVQLSVEGIELETVITESGVEPAILVTENFTLPNETLLLWPCIFNGELNNTAITASFNDVSLTIFNSDTLDNDVIEICIIDIDAFKGESGKLTIKLESNSTLPTSLFLIQNVDNPNMPAIISYLLSDSQQFYLSGQTKYFANTTLGSTGFRTYTEDGTYTGSITLADGTTYAVSGTYDIADNVLTINRTNPTEVTLVLTYIGKAAGGLEFSVAINGGYPSQSISFATEAERDAFVAGF